MNFAELETNDAAQEAWDRYVMASPFGHLFQTCRWGEVAKQLGWSPARYCVKRAGQITAAAQILKRKKGPFTILYVPRGPIFSDRGSFDCLLTGLRQIVCKEKALFCKINPCHLQSPEIQTAYRENGLVRSPTREMHVCTYRIDLTRPLDAIWDDFRSSVRTRIRKAEKSGVIIDSSDTPENLADFYGVYQTLSEQNRVSTHTYGFIRKVWETFSPLRRVKVFTAKLNGKPVAAEFVFLHERMGELMWVANLRLENDLGASQLVHWAIIRWLKENGYRVYDLGGVPPRREELPGVYFHKESLGGNLTELAGEYEIEGSGWRMPFWRFYRRIRGGKKK